MYRQNIEKCAAHAVLRMWCAPRSAQCTQTCRAGTGHKKGRRLQVRHTGIPCCFWLLTPVAPQAPQSTSPTLVSTQCVVLRTACLVLLFLMPAASYCCCWSSSLPHTWTSTSGASDASSASSASQDTWQEEATHARRWLVGPSYGKDLKPSRWKAATARTRCWTPHRSKETAECH